VAHAVVAGRFKSLRIWCLCHDGACRDVRATVEVTDGVLILLELRGGGCRKIAKEKQRHQHELMLGLGCGWVYTRRFPAVLV
jgi:hypothetical protein